MTRLVGKWLSGLRYLVSSLYRRAVSALASTLTLIKWQSLHTWQLLIVTGAGLLLAVVLVCALPLYSLISLSAGIRHTLQAEPQNGYLTVSAQATSFETKPTLSASPAVNSLADSELAASQALTFFIQSELGKQISDQPVFSVQGPALAVTATQSIQLMGTDISQAARHLTLLKGRLPHETNGGNTIEFVLTQEGQSALKAHLGQIFKVPYPLRSPSTGQTTLNDDLTLQLVGIVAPPDENDLFWHGEVFAKSSYFVKLQEFTTYPVIVSNTKLMDSLTAFSTAHITANGPQLLEIPELYWYYDFNLSDVDIDTLPALIRSLGNTLTQIPGTLADPTIAQNITNVTATGPLSALQNYSDQITVEQLPTLSLTLIIDALVLFFVSLMASLLMERHAEEIALIRSRGASVLQVFGSLLGQCVGLCIIALVAGPLLAIPLTAVLAVVSLPAGDRSSLDLITTNPFSVVQGLAVRDLLVVGIALLVMIFSIWSALRSNVLAFRRESARSSYRSFWVRYRLDLLAAVVSLTGFGFSLYLVSPGILDIHARTLILPLTGLVGVLLLLLSCFLFFLRLFPLLLRWIERLSVRKRGIVSVLALAQIARAPRQSLRLILLFSLAVAFLLFSVVYNATESTRLQDLAAFQVGGDYSGQIAPTLSNLSWDQQQNFYRGIKGITSVTLGETSLMNVGGGEYFNLEAVDSSTYASTMYWTPQDGSQSSIDSLMQQLRERRALAEKQHIIPTIIDDTAAQLLSLGVGQRFTLTNYQGALKYEVIGIEHYLPTISDTAFNVSGDDAIPQGGVLVDFQTYSAIAQAVNQEGVTATQVWLRSNSDAKDLTSERGILFSGIYALGNGLDRRAQTQDLETNPLYIVLLGLLAIGAIVALLLGLFGNLLTSWLNARTRQTGFAVLRALGCGPGQVISLLTWEQGLVYCFALGLGVLLCVIFSWVVLPVFVFSPVLGMNSLETFYVVQSVPAVQTVVPIGALLGIMALLIGICIVAVIVMVRVVGRSQVSQVLRLNED